MTVIHSHAAAHRSVTPVRSRAFNVLRQCLPLIVVDEGVSESQGLATADRAGPVKGAPWGTGGLRGGDSAHIFHLVLGDAETVRGIASVRGDINIIRRTRK